MKLHSFQHAINHHHCLPAPLLTKLYTKSSLWSCCMAAAERSDMAVNGVEEIRIWTLVLDKMERENGLIMVYDWAYYGERE